MSAFNNDLSDYLGQYLQRVYQAPLLSLEAETALAIRMKAGGRDAAVARNELVTAHLKMVVPMARKFLGYGVSLADLIQEGSVGLLTAADKFNHKKGVRFSTYAWFWVQNSIREFARDGGTTVRIPASKRRLISAMHKALKSLREGAETPTDEKLAKHMQISVEEVRQLAEYALFEVSLHAKIGDGDTEFGDMLPDTSAVDPDSVLMAAQQTSALHDALSDLKPREREVITARFGLGGDEEQTLDTLAKRYGVSRERIRQIEVKAKQKLARTTGLRNFL